MVPSDLKEIMAHWGYSNAEFARVLDVHRSAITRWLAGKPMDKWNTFQLRDFQAIMRAQRQAIGQGKERDEASTDG